MHKNECAEMTETPNDGGRTEGVHDLPLINSNLFI